MPRILNPGTRLIGRYEVLAFHAEGGMQEVYLCRDLVLGREVALKTPKQGVKDRRFRRGAEMGARVNHPNIAATFDYYEDDALTFLVEEFIPGVDLGRRLQEQFEYLDPSLAAHAIHHIARGLEEAHKVGICHRDLKPSNVMTSADLGLASIKLTDFGIAKLAENELEAEIEEFNKDESTLTSSGTLLGAVPYMAPECWDDWKAAGQPMDIWALGCVAYHLLAGFAPFGTGRQAIANVVKFQGGRFDLKKPAWFGRHKNTETLEDELWSLIEACIKSDPADRIDAEEVVRRCDAMCYADAPRIAGNIATYPLIYQNGGRGDCGFIFSDGEEFFFHLSEFFGDGKPSQGQRVSYSLYPGVPKPRVCPVLLLKS